MRNGQEMNLTGEKVVLRKAAEPDRGNVFEWLTRSDITPSMMGPPLFPEHPIPTWEEFCRDFGSHYFDDSRPEAGRCFIIVSGGTDTGAICYNAIRSFSTDIDIWLKSEADCGKGIGSDAIKTLADHLNKGLGVKRIAISPSARNQRAIAAYRKCGFQPIPKSAYRHYVESEEMEYTDNVVLVKEYP